MSSVTRFLNSPAALTLVAGLALGAIGTASVVAPSTGSTAKRSASPEVSVSQQPINSTTVRGFEGLNSLNESFADLAETVRPAVVHIKVSNNGARNPMGQRVVMGGEGSGVIFREDGYIITNDHVVGGYDSVKVILDDGREFTGKVMRAEESDIAVVKIEANDLPTLPFADSRTVRAGEFAMAVGAPFGLENTVTIGHVSAVQRMNDITDPRTGKPRVYWDLIQTDASINMGNSGGPLININGEVIGINSSIFSTTGQSGGIGFAITSNQARMLAETLIEKGKITRSYMGVYPENLKKFEMQQLGTEKGAILREVPSNGPAAAAGLKVGDVVTRVGQVQVENQADLRSALLRYSPNSKVEVEVLRDGQARKYTVTLKEPPAAPTAPQPQVRGNDMPGLPDIPDIDRLRERFRDRDFMDIVPEGMPKRARLGVSVEDVTTALAKTYKLPEGTKGAVITSVQQGSLADRLGLKPGDVLQKLGDKTIASASDVAGSIRSFDLGQSVKVQFLRMQDGSPINQTIEVKFE